MDPRARTLAAAGGLLLLLAALSIPLGPLPSALGPLLSPATGIFAAPDEPASGTFTLPGLSAPVTVARDAYGIPHIFASKDEDAISALGYVHAQDRLFQMEMQRRAASGRLSEVAGNATVELDKFMRTIGVRRAAEASWADASAEERRLLEAYVRGVNGYLERLPDSRLPTELKLLGLRPEPWTPVDSLGMGKIVGYLLSAGLNDLENEAIVQAFGAETAWGELFPADNRITIPIIPDEEWPPPGVPGAGRKNASPSTGAVRFVGSNNWVVGPGMTNTGAPLLSGDPHLPIQLPPLWYEAHIVYPGVNVYGITGPGLPVPIIGFNDRVAWSMTTTGADVTDLYRYSWDGGGRYLHRGEWLEPKTWAETVKVRGKPDVPLTIRETVHGPLLTRYNQTFAVRATCYQPTHEGLALLLFARARNHTDFQEGLRHWKCPAQNIVYGDRDGTIALWVTGAYPIRKGHDGSLPVNGSALTEEDWVGYVPLEAYPHAVNPRQGYLVSANQMPARGYEYCLPNGTSQGPKPSNPGTSELSGSGPCADLGREFADNYRARRIHELLANRTHTLQTLAQAQFDRTAVDGREFGRLIVAAYDSRPALRTPPLDRAVVHLRNWGGEMLPPLVAPTLYGYTMKALWNLTWADDYVAAGLTAAFKKPAIDRTEELAKTEPDSRWFDLAWTPQRETRDDLLVMALAEAVEGLEERFGPDMDAWTWERAWSFRVAHISGIKGLGRGPFSIGGWFLTPVPIAILSELPPSVPDFEFFPPGSGFSRDAVASASWRMVVDLADPSRSLAVIPGGQRGDFSSPHYDDLLQLWLRGEHHPVQFALQPGGLAAVESRAELRP
ncbi:MAG: penicillin acylase family protein [Halobacteria archaeon]